MNKRIVLKFGGKSLSTVEQIHKVKSIVLEYAQLGYEVVTVVSAMGTMTDELIALAHCVVKAPSVRELDLLVSVGERISMTLLTMALLEGGVDAISFTGSQSGILTTNDFTEAKIADVKPQRILEALGKGKLVVVAGFQGVSLEKEVTTLGRGGSDTTAIALAAAIEADRVVFYKDVPGLFDKNPHEFPDALLLQEVDYTHAYNILVHEKRPILDLRALQLARKLHILIYIHSFEPQMFQKKTGTVIRDKKPSATLVNTYEVEPALQRD
ncbi:MAG: aspartate kinase [Chlamydiia bacterium]